jgi:hypothetical protein
MILVEENNLSTEVLDAGIANTLRAILAIVGNSVFFLLQNDNISSSIISESKSSCNHSSTSSSSGLAAARGLSKHKDKIFDFLGAVDLST